VPYITAERSRVQRAILCCASPVTNGFKLSNIIVYIFSQAPFYTPLNVAFIQDSVHRQKMFRKCTRYKKCISYGKNSEEQLSLMEKVCGFS